MFHSLTLSLQLVNHFLLNFAYAIHEIKEALGGRKEWSSEIEKGEGALSLIIFNIYFTYIDLFAFSGCLPDCILVMRKQSFINVKEVICVKSTIKILTQS